MIINLNLYTTQLPDLLAMYDRGVGPSELAVVLFIPIIAVLALIIAHRGDPGGKLAANVKRLMEFYGVTEVIPCAS